MSSENGGHLSRSHCVNDMADDLVTQRAKGSITISLTYFLAMYSSLGSRWLDFLVLACNVCFHLQVATKTV